MMSYSTRQRASVCLRRMTPLPSKPLTFAHSHAVQHPKNAIISLTCSKEPKAKCAPRSWKTFTGPSSTPPNFHGIIDTMNRPPPRPRPRPRFDARTFHAHRSSRRKEAPSCLRPANQDQLEPPHVGCYEIKRSEER